jgi:DNA replication protein DnaC
MIEQTYNQLAEMKMHALAKALREHAETGTYDHMPFVDRVATLVDSEWHDRQQKRVTRRLKQAKLRDPASVEQIDYGKSRTGLDVGVIQRLATCKWVTQHENVILCGPTGVGKTFVACALANQACRKGFSSMYRRVPRLMQELTVARADGSYAGLLASWAKVDVLVLDDWGLTPPNDQERRDLLEVIEDRYQRRATVVTSQLPIEQWHEYLGDPTVADAILDRLVHNAHKLCLDGPSVRPPLDDADKPLTKEVKNGK